MLAIISLSTEWGFPKYFESVLQWLRECTSIAWLLCPFSGALTYGSVEPIVAPKECVNIDRAYASRFVRKPKIQLSLRVVFFSLALLTTRAGQAAERQVVRGHVPAAVSGLAPLGRAPVSQQLHLAISLPLRNQPALDNLLKQLYDPASPLFHHYLGPAQFNAAFGPAEKDYQSLIDFAKSNRLSVIATHPNRRLLEVTAPVADIEKAFHVTLRVYRHPTENRTFYSPDVEPSLDLDIPVLSIAGLNNFLVPHPSLRAQPIEKDQKSRPNGGSGVASTYIGQDFRSAYLPGVSLNGAGQSLGLFEFDSYYRSDITQYLTNAGLGTNVTLTNAVLEDLAGYPSVNEFEVALDIDMALSMAPGLSNIIVYEAPNNTSYADVVLDAMAEDDLCQQLSCSWTGFYDAGVAQAFQQFAAQGQSFFIASGDVGAYTASLPVELPCDSTNITVVGGTTLSTTGPKGSWVSEKTWSWFTQPFNGSTDEASSGGVSLYYLIPPWQAGISMASNLGSPTFRNIPDVAIVGDDLSWSANGVLLGGGGTSASAPLWAGFAALVNQHAAAHGQPRIGFLNPALYAIGQGPSYNNSFHDITTGNNTNLSTSTNYFAVAGYDLCTGWGTPSGSNLINALVPFNSPITPTLAWTNPAPIIYGTALGASQLNATASVPGSFAYNPAASATLGAGTNILSVVFTPTDTYDYAAVTNTVTIIVTMATPVITWANPSGIVYGTALSAAQLNATANVAGTFIYNPGLGTVMPAGNSQTISATFTPNDTTNYSNISSSVTLVVSPAALTITANNASKAYGAALPAFTAGYSGLVNGDTAARVTRPVTPVS